ncbi:TPA: hypothetical protein HA316_01865, partial [Candidatus Micrarchaeota archaeon]|nr:hypothetical protein [Candidatus Micrarchaeota archaeon]
MAKRPKPTNEQIIAVIAGIDNVPAALGVSRALSAEGLSYSNTSVRSRIEANPLIGEAMEKRGRAYLEGLSDPELFRRVNNMGWK